MSSSSAINGSKGGVGLLVVEAAVVLPSRSSYNLRISDDSLTDGLKGLVRCRPERESGDEIGIQIMHFLKIARSGWRQRWKTSSPRNCR